MDMEAAQTNLELPPLKVKCTDADCNRELHCFKFLKRTMPETDHGACRYCGVKLVDWERVQARDGGDIQHTFDELQHEYIRHHFWHKAIDEKATLHARRKGRTALIASVRRRVETSVGRATPYRDGQQTPMEGRVMVPTQRPTVIPTGVVFALGIGNFHSSAILLAIPNLSAHGPPQRPEPVPTLTTT